MSPKYQVVWLQAALLAWNNLSPEPLTNYSPGSYILLLEVSFLFTLKMCTKSLSEGVHSCEWVFRVAGVLEFYVMLEKADMFDWITGSRPGSQETSGGPTSFPGVIWCVVFKLLKWNIWNRGTVFMFLRDIDICLIWLVFFSFCHFRDVVSWRSQ